VQVSIVNTIIYCKSWSECVAFYRDDLKFEVVFANEWFMEFKVNEAASLSVVDERRSLSGTASGEGVMLSFRVDDVNSVRSEMELLELDPTPIATVWDSPVFSIFDPEGVRIEFWSQD